MQKTDLLIRTKLRLPFTRPNLVPRTRLQEQIAHGLHGPLTLIVAPAGFGKTTLVASSIAQSTIQAAWLSLDRDDNQPGRFLTYLVAALQNADSQIGQEAAQLLLDMQSTPPEIVLTSLINDLDARSTDLVLVLDDYQFINNPAIHTVIAFVLEHCPSTFHLLIATRSDPPLPLARLRARGQLIELRAVDLRFTDLEAAQFLNDVMGLGLDASSVEILEERTEGWVAGLQMAALSLRNRADVREFIAGFSGTNRHILDYLLEEILNTQPADVQRFLLYTSILERLSAPLCDALLTEENQKIDELPESHPEMSSFHQSAGILEYLEQKNLFLVSLDDERNWYRYHHLFADLLRARLHQIDPDKVSILHIRASNWLEGRGFIPEAIQHLFTAHEMGRAADLIEPYGLAWWAESDTSIVQMADNLPREVLLSRPRLGMYLAWLLICQGRIERAGPLLLDLAKHINEEPGLEYHWIKTIVTIAVAFLTRSVDIVGSDSLPDYHELDEIPPAEIILRDAADILYGLLLVRLGKTDQAVEVAARCIQREKTSRGILPVSTLISFLTRIYLIQGHLHAAASLCREYLEAAQEKGLRLVSTSGSLNIVLGEVLYEWNCLDEAEKLIRDGLHVNQPWHNIMTDAFGLIALARALQSKGDTTGALQVVEKFETRVEEGSRPIEFEADAHTLRIRLQIASGDLMLASEWADQIQLSEEFHRHEEQYRPLLAQICLAQGRYAEAEEILRKTPPLQTSHPPIPLRLQSDLLLALALAGQGRASEALEILESALALAEPEGFVRTFVDLGNPVRDLLVAYQGSSAPGHASYAQQLLDAFSPTREGGPSIPQQSGLVEPLSGRELEVLQNIALGRTNQEIAQQLVVAPGTIKAHTASIYRKLDVTNRTEAVARARQLGLLP